MFTLAQTLRQLEPDIDQLKEIITCLLHNKDELKELRDHNRDNVARSCYNQDFAYNNFIDVNEVLHEAQSSNQQLEAIAKVWFDKYKVERQYVDHIHQQFDDYLENGGLFETD